MHLQSKNLPFYAFIIAFFLIMIGPYLLSHGMFMDGIIYATVSNNLANGLGTYSDLAFSETIVQHFREHPPLAFWIQSLIYKLFGDSYVIEKIYSAITYIITAIIIIKIWFTVSKKKYLAWLPLLFWISIPIITQAARNNLLENTMMIFTSLALYFLLIKNSKTTTNIAIAGMLIYLGFMTKGFVALFIWSVPFWQFLISKRTTFNKMVNHTGLLLVFTVLPFVILSLLYPASYQYLADYFKGQVTNSLKNIQTVDSRFWILTKLLKELITPLILFVIIYLFNRFFRIKIKKSPNNKTAMILLAVALSGVIPICLSLKQSGFYFIPSLAIFSLSFSLFVEQLIDNLYQKISINQIGFKLAKYITLIAIIVSLFIITINAGTNGRDDQKLTDIKAVSNRIGNGQILDLNISITGDWSTFSYFYRYYKISINLTKTPSKKYLLTLNSQHTVLGYEPVKAIKLNHFKLYEKQ